MTTKFKQGHPHTAVFGITGGGKTTLIKRMIAKCNRLVVWDTMEDIGEQGDDKSRIRPVDHPEMLDAFSRAYKGHRHLRIAYQPDRKRLVPAFDNFCENVMAAQGDFERHGKELTVVVDELDRVFPRAVPQEHPFSELVRRGRHYGIRLIGATQFPTTVNSDFRRNCSISYLFPLGAEGPTFVASAYKNKQASEKMLTLANHTAVVLETGAPEPWQYENPPLK